MSDTKEQIENCIVSLGAREFLRLPTGERLFVLDDSRSLVIIETKDSFEIIVRHQKAQQLCWN